MVVLWLQSLNKIVGFHRIPGSYKQENEREVSAWENSVFNYDGRSAIVQYINPEFFRKWYGVMWGGSPSVWSRIYPWRSRHGITMQVFGNQFNPEEGWTKALPTNTFVVQWCVRGLVSRRRTATGAVRYVEAQYVTANTSSGTGRAARIRIWSCDSGWLPYLWTPHMRIPATGLILKLVPSILSSFTTHR